MRQKPKFKFKRDQFLNAICEGASWVINQETGLIDVDGHVRINRIPSGEGFLPASVSFGEVKGDFWYTGNDLKSLKGFPLSAREVMVNNCRLEKIEWHPEINLISSIYINFKYVEDEFMGGIIEEMEALLDKGLRLKRYDYNSRKELYYERKLAELL